jgi:hypothetical protein
MKLYLSWNSDILYKRQMCWPGYSLSKFNYAVILKPWLGKCPIQISAECFDYLNCKICFPWFLRAHASKISLAQIRLQITFSTSFPIHYSLKIVLRFDVIGVITLWAQSIWIKFPIFNKRNVKAIWRTPMNVLYSGMWHHTVRFVGTHQTPYSPV